LISYLQNLKSIDSIIGILFSTPMRRLEEFK
jgi:hypothetical protein